MTKTKTVRMSAATFAKVFARLKAAGVRPAEIAEALGVHRVTLYRWAAAAESIRPMATKAIRRYAKEKLG